MTKNTAHQTPTPYLHIMIIALLTLTMSACAGASADRETAGGDTIQLKYATNLTMVDFGEYLKADLRNPWDSTKTLQTFLLIPREQELPASLPEGIVIRTPLQAAIVYTTAHSGLMHELGVADAIRGVCDAKYIHDPVIRRRIDDGSIADCGSAMAPNIEKILMLKPDAILLSAFEDSNDHNKVSQTGIPIIDCADYMETSPLARAEWMKFYGRLFGKRAEADSLFAIVESAYTDIKTKIDTVSHRPLVLTEMIYGQTWSVPAAMSTIGILIHDAGGNNPFEAYRRSGSVQLAPEEVLFRAKDADVWLLKYASPAPPTLSSLQNDNPIYAKFRAFTTGNVYACDTNGSTYFEDLAFHPHWILAELASILHPGIAVSDTTHHYHTKLTK